MKNKKSRIARHSYWCQNDIKLVVPPRQVSAGVQVAVEGVSAVALEESSVSRADFTARRAGLGSHVRTDLDDFNSQPFCLVCDEVLKLEEAPTVKPEVPSLSSFLFSDSFEVFQHDNWCFTTLNYAFADDVIPISLETSLFPAKVPEQLAGISSAFALEPRPQMLIPQHRGLNESASEEAVVAGRCDVVYSSIDTEQKSVKISPDFDAFGKSDVQESSLLGSCEFGCLILPAPILFVIRGDVELDADSSSNGRELDFVPVELGVSDVEVKRHQWLECGLASFIRLDAFESLRGNPVCVNYELAWQTKSLSDIVICEMVELVSVGDACFESFVCDVTDGFGISLHRVQQERVKGNLDFYRGDGLHIAENTCGAYILYDCPMEETGFLPLLKQGVSALTIL